MLVAIILKDGAIYAAGVVSSLVLLFIMRDALTYKTTKKDWIMVDFVRFCFMGTPMTDYEKTAAPFETAVGRRALRHC